MELQRVKEKKMELFRSDVSDVQLDDESFLKSLLDLKLLLDSALHNYVAASAKSLIDKTLLLLFMFFL